MEPQEQPFVPPEALQPPSRSSSPKRTWQSELAQGWGYIRFVWLLAMRIRRGRDRIRFVIGLIFWKPFLPKEN